MTVVIIGSANLDTVVTVHRHPQPGETVHGTGSRYDAGGKGLNQAIAATRAGVETVFIGAVGDDEAGRDLSATLGTNRVATRIATSSCPTGSATVVVAEDGENSIIVLPGANGDAEAIVGIGDVIGSLCSNDVVLSQLEIPIPVVQLLFRESKTRGALTILNAAPSKDVPLSVLDDVDVLVVNEHECLDLAEASTVDAAAALLANLVSTVIVTLGGAGALIVTAGTSQMVPAFRVTAVDTTAAGDTFCGAFAARLALTGDLSASARFGNAAAALSVQAHGASASTPELEVILALIAGHDPDDL